jgi:N-acetylneuraminate synthase
VNTPYTYEDVKRKTDSFLSSIDKRQVTPENVTSVAEIGINHNGDVDTAKKLIDVSEKCGFDFVKFQKRTPEVCVPEWKKSQLRQTPFEEDPIPYIEYKRHIEFGKEEFDELFRYVRDLNVSIFSSVWDNESVDFMAQYTDVGKIPSAHLTNKELTGYAREKFDFLIVSTGMSTEQEVQESIWNCDPDVVMHSVSSYPTKAENLQLEYIRHLKRTLRQMYGTGHGKELGYSGHETELETAAAAVALGSKWMERHVTLDRDMWGSDQFASLEPDEMYRLIEILANTEKSLSGDSPRTLLDEEKEKRKDLRK